MTRDNAESLTSAATAAVEARSNTPASGAPVISGTAQVGETLTASTTGIADADGLTNVSYAYQWVRNDGTDDSDIGGATGSSYTLVSGDQGKAITVRVDFSDDDGNAESLTSAATAAVAAPPPDLTAGASGIPASHDGSTAFTFELRFSEEFPISYVTLRDHAFTATGGEVVRAERLNPPANIAWRITVRPDGNGAVTLVLPITTDCAAQGSICTADGRRLSRELDITAPGPGD